MSLPFIFHTKLSIPDAISKFRIVVAVVVLQQVDWSNPRRRRLLILLISRYRMTTPRDYLRPICMLADGWQSADSRLLTSF